ncbi:hypothetical protein [Telluribacter humicola]|uniref:hypothetical protein n=1 Tax=Telluribacter humicola TaxID=1720261 RepID=UPI001A96AC97|nr:hypothetical protein [Telluribacter humicola]
MLSPDTYLFPYFLVTLFLLLLFGIATFRNPDSSLRTFSGYGLLALPILYFFYIIYSHTVNIPFTDDYELLKSFYRLMHAPEPMERVKSWFEQVNQHRFAFERVVMLSIYQVMGSEDIKAQIIVGDLFLLGILYLLYRLWKAEGLSFAAFLPVPFLVFNLIYHENAIWGIAAIQNTALIFFAMLAAYALSFNSTRSYYGALVCTIVITFVSGSGIAVWLIGLIIMGLQKRYRQMIIWVVVAGLVGLFYFLFDYVYLEGDNSALFNNLFYNLIYGLSFMGGTFYMDRPHPMPSAYYLDVLVSVLAGAVLVAIFIWFSLRIILQKSTTVRWTYWFLLGSMLFLLATGAMLVLSRPVSINIIWGGEIFARRYMIFGMIFMACCYLAVVMLLRNNATVSRLFVGVSLVLAVGINLASYYISLQHVRIYREDLLIDTYYWPTHRMLLTTGEDYGQKFFWNHPTMMTNLVQNLDQSGLYQYPAHPLTPLTTTLASVPVRNNPADKGIMNIKSEKKPGWERVIKNRVTLTYKLPDEPAEELKYVALRSDKHLFLLPAVPEPRPFLDFLRTGNYYSSEYTYSFWGTKFLKGTYEIWLLYVDGSGKWSRTPTEQTLNL